MAAIRMLFSYLTEKGVLAMNPAREVQTERFSRLNGKTPAFHEGEVATLLAAIDVLHSRRSARSRAPGHPRLHFRSNQCGDRTHRGRFFRAENVG